MSFSNNITIVIVFVFVMTLHCIAAHLFNISIITLEKGN